MTSGFRPTGWRPLGVGWYQDGLPRPPSWAQLPWGLWLVPHWGWRAQARKALKELKGKGGASRVPSILQLGLPEGKPLASGPPADSRCAVLQLWLLADGAPTQRAVGLLGTHHQASWGLWAAGQVTVLGGLKGDQELGRAPKRKRGPGGRSREKRVSVRGQCGGPCPWRQAGVWWAEGGTLSDRFAVLVLGPWATVLLSSAGSR